MLYISIYIETLCVLFHYYYQLINKTKWRNYLGLDTGLALINCSIGVLWHTGYHIAREKVTPPPSPAEKRCKKFSSNLEFVLGALLFTQIFI